MSRNDRYVTYDGLTLNIAGWARHTGLKAGTIIKRLDVGWSIEQALTTKKKWMRPVKPRLQAHHEMRQAVRQFASEQRRAVDEFEQDMLDRLKSAMVAPPGEVGNFSNDASDRWFSSAQATT